MEFPLFKLPYLAFMKVFDNLDAMQLLFITQYKSKILNHTKFEIQKTKIDLEICYQGKYRCVGFRKSGTEDKMLDVLIQNFQQKNIHKWKFNEKVMKVYADGYTVGVFWTSEKVAFKEVILFFLSKFDVQNISFCFDQTNRTLMTELIEFAKSHQLKLRIIDWKVVWDYDFARDIFHLCSNAEYLHFEAPSDFDFENFEHLACERIYIGSAENMAVNHILSLVNLQTVKITGLSLRSEQMNTILEAWINGEVSFTSLELLTEHSSLDVIPVLNGVDFQRVQGVIKVTSRNGIRATVNVKPNAFKLTVDTD